MSGILAGPDTPLRRFRIFSASHLATTGTVVVVAVLIALFGGRLRATAADPVLRAAFGVVILANEVGLSLWRWHHGLWTWRDSLPLHLCGVSVVLVAVMLFTRSYAIFELAYFWAMGGALQGLITPDTEGYDFPHFRFLTTFVSHGTIVIANLYMVFVLGMRPTFFSLLKSLAVVNAYGIVMLVFDLATGANYGFLRRKPDGPTLLDMLGPWPWYLLSLEGLAVAVSFLCYVPFLLFP